MRIAWHALQRENIKCAAITLAQAFAFYVLAVRANVNRSIVSRTARIIVRTIVKSVDYIRLYIIMYITLLCVYLRNVMILSCNIRAERRSDDDATRK